MLKIRSNDILYNMSLRYRIFGTKEFGDEIQFVNEYNEEILFNAAMTCRKKYGHACTNAYNRIHYNQEYSCQKSILLYASLGK